MSQGAFSGIRVLAVARQLAAPFAVYQLALQGADVIKVEEPKGGDPMRTAGGRHAKRFLDQGMGPPFLAHGSNSKSMTLDLRHPSGKAIFLKLAQDADVVVENFRAGAMDRYGLGYEHVKQVNPRIVYCSVTGFGQTGPKRKDTAFDPVIQAASGIMSITGTEASGPVKAGAFVSDYAAGYAATVGIMSALFRRERTGEGDYVDVSMLEASLALMSGTASDVLNAGFEPRRVGNRSLTNQQVNDTFMCSDTHILIAASQTTARNAFWKAINRLDIPADPRFSTMDGMRDNLTALYAEIERTLSAKTAAEWEAILIAAGVPCMRVQSLPDALRHPQIVSRGLYHRFDDVPGLGPVSVPLAPYKLANAPAAARTPPPRLGEHTEEVLRQYGYSAEEIAGFRADAVI